MKRRTATARTLRALFSGLILGCACLARGAAHPQKFSFDDFLLAPLRVHLLSASNAPNVHTTLTEADIARILPKLNGIWSQAGITFYLESLVREEAVNQQLNDTLGRPDDLRQMLALRPEATQDKKVFHLYYIRRFSANGVYLGAAMFVKDTASLRKVPGGIDEPLPRVSSHELGHALTLMHHTNDAQLMMRGTTGTNLSEVEIQQARAAAGKLPWIESAPVVWQRGEDLRRGKQAAESCELDRRVAVIPLDDRRVRAARKRAE